MSIFANPSDLLPGLKPAAFRGLTFFVPDASIEIGRRIVATYFPGIDYRAAEDLGRHDGPVHVAGLIVGDDYVQQALALQAALQARGPGTLLHPWLGEMWVVVPEGAGIIRFSVGALRVIRFEVAFMPVPAGGVAAVIGSTLSALLGSVTGLLAAAQGFASAVLGATNMSVAVWSAASATASIIGGIVQSTVAASAGAAAVGDSVALAVATLNVAAAGAGGLDDAAAMAAALVSVAAPIATVAIGDAPSAIGAGGVAVPVSVTLTPRDGAALLLEIASETAAAEAVGLPAAGVRLAGQVMAIAYAVRTAAEIDYASRQDAAAWRDRLYAALDAAEAQVVVLASDLPAEAAPLLSALGQLRAALARDMSETIGRLPAVRLFTPASTVSAWLVAQHFAGDDPTKVLAMFEDIVVRNRLHHPGLVPPDPLEVLV